MSLPTVAPFRGLRYNPEKVGDLSKAVAPPYDVIDEKYREALYARHPNNVIRLILTKDEDGAAQKITKYEVARRTLDQWKKESVLVRDEAPQIYLYHQTYRLEDGRELTRKGFIALRRLESFESGKIRPHEYTFAGPKADRLSLTRAVSANLSPIFGIYRDEGRRVEELFYSALRKKPLIDIETEDGRHQVWGLGDAKLFSELNQRMEPKIVFIADGHHRYETALAYRELMKSEKKDVRGDEPFHYVMMYLCSMEDEGLVILPTHRVVNVPLAKPWSETKKKLEEFFQVSEYASADSPKALSHLRELQTKGHAFLLSLKGGPLAVIEAKEKALDKIPALKNLQTPVRDLDVVILHHYLLPVAFGLDVAEDHDSVKVQYVKETAQALKNVSEGSASLAVIMNPTKMAQVEAISEIGERMPHKSTFFYPKLLSGLVFNPIDPAEKISL